MLAFVASSSDFYEQPKVADGASRLLADIFGEETGLPTRSAIGVHVLPGNIPVEIEMLWGLFQPLKMLLTFILRITNCMAS